MPSAIRFVAVMLISLLATAHAQVPESISYQGYVTNAAGEPLDGAVPIAFALYGDPDSIAALWYDPQTVTVNQGLFSVELGSASRPLPPGLFSTPLWLGIEVSGEELTPRRPLTTAAFAFQAEDAFSLQGSGPATYDQSQEVSLIDQRLSVVESSNVLSQIVATSGGNVGIGTASPATKLQVLGGSDASLNSGSGYAVFGPETSNNLVIDNNEIIARAFDAATSSLTRSTLYLQEGALNINRDKNVGIGIFEAAVKLQVTGGSDASYEDGSGYVVIGNESGANIVVDTNEIIARNNGGDATLYLNAGSGAAVRIPILTITGGADIVEGFEMASGQAAGAGTVMVIDPDAPGMLRVSQAAYDTKVAGVVSGAGGVQPGIRLGQSGVMDGDLPVAMSGRVYVRCTAQNGPIYPGDRLTTAALSGHAMKATDRDLADGAVLGKAMSSLEQGTGLVLVLVNLQ